MAAPRPEGRHATGDRLSRDGIIFVGSNTTGTGRLFVERARSLGLGPVLFSNLLRYPDYNIRLEASSIGEKLSEVRMIRVSKLVFDHDQSAVGCLGGNICFESPYLDLCRLALQLESKLRRQSVQVI